VVEETTIEEDSKIVNKVMEEVVGFDQALQDALTQVQLTTYAADIKKR